MPTDCPDYYTLADGREFVDFFHQECTPLLVPHFDATEIHCIQSAMEHLYRRGRKSYDTMHDQKAFDFWLEKGKSFYVRRIVNSDMDDTATNVLRRAAERAFYRRFKPSFAVIALERMTRWPMSPPWFYHNISRDT